MVGQKDGKMAFITRVATPIVGLSLVIGASTVVRGEEGYDEVLLRCEGTYSERENPQLTGGHDFEMSIMTRHADGRISIMLVGAIGYLGWFFLDQNGSSNSYSYFMTSKNDMLSGWADDSKVPGLKVSNLNLDRTTGVLKINAQRDEGESSFRGVCEAITNRF